MRAMELAIAGGTYLFTLQPSRVVYGGPEVVRGIVTEVDADGRMVSLVVHGPSASTLMIAEGFADLTAFPRLEIHADEGIIALVLDNGPSTNRQLVIIADGISVWTDADGQPLRLVFESVPVDDIGLVDLVIHGRTCSSDSDMGRGLEETPR
jgi:hypothetical protein